MQGSILLRPRSRCPSLAPVASTSGVAFGAAGGATLHCAGVPPHRICAPTVAGATPSSEGSDRAAEQPTPNHSEDIFGVVEGEDGE